MSPEIATRVRAMMRLLAAPGPGETHRSAIWRAAQTLGISGALARALYYSEVERVSDETAEAVLAQEGVALRARLQQLQQETAALQARLLALPEAGCPNDFAGSPSAASAASQARCSASRISATGRASGSSTSATGFCCGADGDLMSALAGGAGLQ